MKKKIARFFTIAMAMCMLLGCITSASASAPGWIDYPIYNHTDTSSTQSFYGNFTVLTPGKKVEVYCVVGMACTATLVVTKPDGSTISHSLQFTKSGGMTATLIPAPAPIGTYSFRLFFNKNGVYYTLHMGQP